MRLTDLWFDGGLAAVVSEELGLPAFYVGDDGETVRVPMPIEHLPEDQQFLAVQIQPGLCGWVRFRKGRHLDGCANLIEGGFLWAKKLQRPPGFVHTIPLASVEQFRDLLQVARAAIGSAEVWSAPGGDVK